MKLNILFWVLIAITAEAKVYCEHPEDCPSAINQLQYKNKRCTAFLVARDLIATNRHCLPEQMNKEREACDGINFVFPKSKNHEPEILKCKTIEFLSEPLVPNSVNVDLAILRTQTTTERESLKLSQDGFQNEKQYTIYKIDPDLESGGGVVIKSNCDAIQNSIVNPYFTSDKSPIVNFIPCEVIPGNSGSPILSSGNEVRGIIHSSSDGKLFELFDKERRKMDTKIYSAFGTSFACVHLDLFSYPRFNHSACQVKINTDSTRQLEMQKNEDLGEQINKQVRIEYEKFIQKLPTLKNEKMHLLQWKFGPYDTQLGPQNHFVYSPLCYNEKEYKKDPAARLNLELLEIELKNEIDTRLRHKFDIKSNIYINKIFLELKPDQRLKVELNYSFKTNQFFVEPCK
jgi:hypothetical protein